MTVETKINKSGPYALDGVRLRFPRTFKLTDASHLRVIRVVDGVETDITGGYTQTGIGANVGEVVFTAGTVPTSGALLLLRSVPLTQETDYANQARVQPEQIERDFDKQEMQIQDMQEQLGRAVKVSASVPNPDDINGPLVDALLRLNDSADNIDTVADHVDNVDTVASNIGAVVNVSDNMRSIVDASGSVLSLYDASYSATAGQRVFTLPHPATADQNVIVWVNRSRLVPGAAYSVDRDILTFSYGLGAEDQVDVLVVSAVSYQAVNNLYDEFQRGTVIYRTDFLTVAGQTLYTADSSGRPLNINPNSHILFGASPYSVLTQGIDYRVENGGYRLLFTPANGELFHSIAMPRVSNSQAQAILEAYKTDVEEFAERAEAAADRVDLGALDEAVSSASEDAQIASAASAAAGSARDQVLSQVISDIRVPTLADRPATGPSAGYVVYVIDSGISYRWTGTAWQDLGTGPLATKSALSGEVANRRALIQNLDDSFTVYDPVGYEVLLVDTDKISLMGRVVAVTPIGDSAVIPAPNGDTAATILRGALNLQDDDPLIVHDELGFEIFRADLTGVFWMGRPIEAPDSEAIEQLAYDADRERFGIDRRTPRPFRRWVSARAGAIAGLGRARIVHVGDSNTMGHSAMGNGQHRRAQSYPTHLATLAADRSPSWGNFFGRAISETSITNLQAYDPRMVVGAGWTAGGPASIGGEMWINSTTTAPLSLTPVEAWDTAEVYIAVDEAVTVEIGIAGARVSHTPAVGQVVKLTYSAATAAQQALQIVRQSGAVRVIGAHCYKSGAGVDILNAGRSGWRSDQYAAVASYYSPLAALPALGADLWVIQLGLNDFDQGRNPASFGADLRAIANAGLAAGASVVLVVSLNPGSIDVYPWADYRGQIYGVAAELGCALVDVGILYGSHAEALADGLVTNDLHPSARGYAETARAIHQLIF